MAEDKLKELLPELPYPPSDTPYSRKQPIEIKHEQTKPKKKPTEEDLLNYIRQTGGFLDVEHFCKIYDVEKDEVFDLLKSLAAKGLVTLEG